MDIAWRDGALDAATLRGRPGAGRLVRYRGQELALTFGASGVARVTLDAGALRAGGST